jgi:DNA-3-methyladenine glycosylase II
MIESMPKAPVTPVAASRRTYPVFVDAGVRHLSRTDPLMRRLIRRHGACGMTPNWTRTPYQALVQAIIHQQLAGAAARAIHGRFVTLVGDGSFPTPERVTGASDDTLRRAGLSRQKASYIRDIAARTLDGTIPRTRAWLAKLPDEAIIERLTEARGVGRWTAEMVLMFTLGRLDVLPVDDYGVRAGYAKAAGRDAVSPRELREVGVAWAPYRSIAAWYFWQTADA